MGDRRVTQRDVAEAAGVHRATVSLALKGHPSIPQSTRDRVLKAAEALGYQADPMLSALAQYRSSLTSRDFQGTIAWLVNVDVKGDFIWDQVDTFLQYYEGAKSRAKLHGYQLEIFEMNTTEIKPKRMASVFKSRGIRGVLLCPQSVPGTVMDFPWDDFSFVTFGYSLVDPHLHTVTATQYRNVTQAVLQAHRLGYRRVAFAFQSSDDERADHNSLAGYLTAQYQLGEQPLVFDYERNNIRPFCDWLKRESPDAVIIGDEDIQRKMKEEETGLWSRLGWACPMLSKRGPELAGVFEDSFHIGEVAADHLTAMIMRGQRGVPKRAQRTHIEGVWNEGKSLPKKPGKV